MKHGCRQIRVGRDGSEQQSVYRQSCNIFKVQKVGMDLVGTVCAVSVMAGLVLRAECDFQHYLEICCSGMS